MAVSGADGARLNRVLTVTLDRYSPQISNELARNDGIIGIFGARKAIKMANGGSRAIETLDVSENQNFGFRSPYSDIPTGKQDTRKQAKYAWATHDGTVTLSDHDKAMNSGESKIYDLVAEEIRNAKNTIVRQIADALRASSPGASNPESLLTLIQDNAKGSQTGSTGEIARNSTYWCNQYSAVSMDLSGTGWEDLMAFMLQDVGKGTAKIDQPDFGLTNGTLFAALSYQGDTNRRYLGPDNETMKLGFSNIVINGATVISDPAIAAGDLYLINTNHTFLQVLRTPNMKNIGDRPQTIPISVRPFQTAYNSLHTASVMYVTLAFTSSSLQRNGIASNCS